MVSGEICKYTDVLMYIYVLRVAEYEPEIFFSKYKVANRKPKNNSTPLYRKRFIQHSSRCT